MRHARRWEHHRSAVALVLAMTVGAPAAAQLDYRNLDAERPTRVEDAYPVERYAFDLVIPYRFERDDGGGWAHASPLELVYGVARNMHVGVTTPLMVTGGGGPTETGLSGIEVLALYNVNTESQRFPAVSLRGVTALPVGGLAGDEVQAQVQAIATRSWGRHRLHLNAAYRFGRDEPASGGLDRWWVGGALDRTLLRQSVVAIGEVYARQAREAGPVDVTATLGVRWQWRPTAVIDLGVSRRFDDATGGWAVTMGLSHAFALAGWMPGRR